jgi:hypothetical protein
VSLTPDEGGVRHGRGRCVSSSLQNTLYQMEKRSLLSTAKVEFYFCASTNFFVDHILCLPFL